MNFYSTMKTSLDLIFCLKPPALQATISLQRFGTQRKKTLQPEF